MMASWSERIDHHQKPWKQKNWKSSQKGGRSRNERRRTRGFISLQREIAYYRSMQRRRKMEANKQYWLLIFPHDTNGVEEMHGQGKADTPPGTNCWQIGENERMQVDWWRGKNHIQYRDKRNGTAINENGGNPMGTINLFGFFLSWQICNANWINGTSPFLEGFYTTNEQIFCKWQTKMVQKSSSYLLDEIMCKLPISSMALWFVCHVRTLLYFVRV